MGISLDMQHAADAIEMYGHHSGLLWWIDSWMDKLQPMNRNQRPQRDSRIFRDLAMERKVIKVLPSFHRNKRESRIIAAFHKFRMKCHHEDCFEIDFIISIKPDGCRRSMVKVLPSFRSISKFHGLLTLPGLHGSFVGQNFHIWGI